MLKTLPVPVSDLTEQRTWPGQAETGWINLGQPQEDGQRSFLSMIPRRYGASGVVPGAGLFANGLWHPQPVLSRRVPVTRWEVELHLPPGTVGVLNSTVGEGTLRWAGLADRLSLAVIPGGRAQRIDPPGQSLVIVSGGRQDPRQTALLKDTIAQPWPLVGGEPIVVVLAPMHRRLARPGAGMVFLSQRATRLSAGLWRHHTNAIGRGILSAGVLNADPWARGIAANHHVDQMPKGPTASDTLAWLAWIPDIDAILYDGSLPFNSEVMGYVWPSDPLKDDTLEMVEDVVPSAVAARKIAGLTSPEAMAQLVASISAGLALDDAAAKAQVSPELIAQWRKMPPEQNLALRHLALPDGTAEVQISRQAPKTAPPEPVAFKIDGTLRHWQSGAGSSQTTIKLKEPAQQVLLDPGKEVKQTRLDDDGWPARWTPTFAFGLNEFNLSESRPSASLHGWLRRRYGTRWVYGGHLGTNTVDIASGAISISRSLGPLIDQRRRVYQVAMSLGASLLDPAFRPTDQGEHAIDTHVGLSRDTHNAWPLPRRGHRLFGSAGMGFVPQSSQRWSSWSSSATGVVPINSWAVLAGRGTGGMSLGGIPHRLRSLGGTGRIQGLGTDAVLGHSTATASLELRALPIRRASIPLPLAWGTDLQLSAGIDSGIAWTDSGQVRATGWSTGIAGVADLLGAKPGLLGIWVAAPIPELSADIPSASPTQVRLRFVQAY